MEFSTSELKVILRCINLTMHNYEGCEDLTEASLIEEKIEKFLINLEDSEIVEGE